MYKYRFKNCREKLIDLSVGHVFGLKKVEYSSEEVIVLCLVKNGQAYIEDFIKHYFKLGAKHIVFLDNGSSDRTIEIAKKFDNVTILQTNFMFKNGNNMAMRNYLINRFSKNKWSLCVDIDEFFDYPYSNILGIKGLLKYLNENGYSALATQMLDMLPNNIERGRGMRFDRNNYKNYDVSGVFKKRYFFENAGGAISRVKIYFGGVRKKLFGLSNLCLTKHALVFNDIFTERGKSGHLLEKGKVADFSAVLLHYKFTDDFFEQVQEAVLKEQYFNRSSEYKSYHQFLKNCKTFDFKKYDFKILENVNDLIKADFLVVSHNYKNFCGLSEEERRNEDVAVVIGVKNRLDSRIENAFKSLKNQDYKGGFVKIILVDYCSRSDISKSFEELCRKYEADYVRIEGEEIWNRSRALNIGIKRADSKYVLCSDVDIIFEKNYISECTKEIRKNPKQVLWSGMLDLQRAGENFFKEKKDYEELKKNAVSRNLLQDMNYPYGLSINFTLAKYYFDVHGYDENYFAWGCEDDDIIKRFKMLGLEITNISGRTSYLHQWHPMYEGLNGGKKSQIIKNREYLAGNNSILRNKNGWGLVNGFQKIQESCSRAQELGSRFDALRGTAESGDLAVVCCYFNPCRYKTRLENYKIFRKGIMAAGVKLLTVELAFGADGFELDGFSDILQLRTSRDNVMWQKERLLNIGIEKLIVEGYKKIAWLDADIVFEKNNWAGDLSKKLDEYPLVQVFKKVYRDEDRGRGGYCLGSAGYYKKTGRLNEEIARPGFGWAARAPILKEAFLYDRAVATTENDSLIFWASFFAPGVSLKFFLKYAGIRKLSASLFADYVSWAKKWGTLVQGGVGFLDFQNVRALYHGAIKDRRYGMRDVYKEHSFNPKKDLRISESGIFTWASHKHKMHKEIRDYFYSRREDE